MGKTVQVSGFPSNITADEVKVYLEGKTGEGTIYALKVRPPKSGTSRSYAIVQFTTVRCAETIIALTSSRLWFGTSYLKARYMDNDIVPKPRANLHRLQNITLHFGCQMSNEKFFALWSEAEVSVEFGIGLRRLNFWLTYRSVEYRLQFSYENIWQIELHKRSNDPDSKYLLIQLLGAPRIFKKEMRSSFSIYDDPRFNFFQDTLDDQWVRVTDFTPDCSIGQSSALYLELPSGVRLPNFRENFAYYQEKNYEFILQSGSSFSGNKDLVPIVSPPFESRLPYGILFKINLLLQNGCLSGPTLDKAFYRLVDPHFTSIDRIDYALEKLYNLKECCYNPSSWLKDQYRKYLESDRPPKSPAIALDSGLMYVRRVQVTPCKVFFCGPEINVSNRVLREHKQHIDNFIRVSFVDEELDKLFSTDLARRSSGTTGDKKTELYRRILSVLKNGIQIGDMIFEFLAFSSSQLRDNSVWMFAKTGEHSAASIRRGMGDFRSIRNVAKYAARLGQSFGSSTETLTVSKDEIEVIPDVKVIHNGIELDFSDGIGKISFEFAKKVAHKCGLKGFVPSAFQIRYGGYKGVVAVDPTSSVKLSLRKSMLKYESLHDKLDVLAYSKFQPCYLNRQLISLLSTLGIEDHVFEKKQREAVEQLDAILTDPLKASEALELMSSGEMTNVLHELLTCGYKPDKEPFLKMMLQTFRASKLQELRTRTRVFVPNGRAMMGCLDETRTLEYGQVFVMFSGIKNRRFFDDSGTSGGGTSRNQHFVVQGKVVVAKNPCLHPGDVRVLEAINVPALHHMVDCVVFPQKGRRPHPNECSGSDLDGDIYFVCWDDDLIPRKHEEPMDYTPAPSTRLDHDVTIEEVQEYFADYIVNDSLGIIANAHTAKADSELLKARSRPCIELAKLFSVAVDFPKTGVPAIIPQELYVKEFPDFMEKPDKPTYESKRVIGKLFREVKEKSALAIHRSSFTREAAREAYDLEMEVDGFEDFVDDAVYYKTSYDYKLGNLLDYYGIKSEAEIISGSIMKMSKSFTTRRDAESINLAVRALRKEARAWFNEKGNNLDSEADDVYAKASAWYHVTYHPNFWGHYNDGMKRDHYLSFPWCIYDKLVVIKRQSLRVSSLERAFRELR